MGTKLITLRKAIVIMALFTCQETLALFDLKLQDARAIWWKCINLPRKIFHFLFFFKAGCIAFQRRLYWTSVCFLL